MGLLLFVGYGSSLVAASPDAEGVRFFETHIRPLLVEHCYECHQSGDQAKGGLSLDTRAGWLKGGQSGPAIQPGNPGASLLVQAVRRTRADLEMPPKKALSADQVQKLEQWVQMGAPDPRDEVPKLGPFEQLLAQAGDHWAFRPIRKPAVPNVPGYESWGRNPIDAFVLKKLKEHGMEPASPAPMGTLLRRASVDLTGLPVPNSLRQSLQRDGEKMDLGAAIKELLDSPTYGERWARHWLDVARYADTKGYLAGGVERRFPYSYTYRDYVIDSFNQDKPYHEFLIEQLAADKLELGQDQRALAGLGFLTLGRRFLNNTQDIIDDRIDVVSRGLMGLTTACARCHDHKFDPVSMVDYYGLYSIFNSSEEPEEKPLLGIDPSPEAHQAYLAEKAKLEQELEDFRSKRLADAVRETRERTGDYLLAAYESQWMTDRKEADKVFRQRKLHLFLIQQWQSAREGLQKQLHPVWSYWAHYAALKPTEFATRQAEIHAQLKKLESEGKVSWHPALLQWFPAGPESMEALCNKIGVWAAASLGDKKAKGKLENGLEESWLIALREEMETEKYPGRIADSRNGELLSGDAPALRSRQAKIDRLAATHEGAPARAMVLVDRAQPRDGFVFIRGNAGSRGAPAPRGYWGFLSSGERITFQDGSGRLELARRIASSENPLTARVWVNRVWMHHFGQGLAETADDFGLRSELPSHPELLDWLAASFMEKGWSNKWLHQQILNSATWRQASSREPDVEKRYSLKDSDNRLLWRMNRRRLDLESMRDHLLAISGTLDRKMGGQPVDITTEPFSHRRSVYAFIERQNLPNFFRTFDFANPEASNGRRFQTTVPQQALFLLNGSFLREMAENLTKLDAGIQDPAQRVQSLIERVLGRAPKLDETRDFLSFLKSAEATDWTSGSAWRYGIGRLDGAGEAIRDFKPFPVAGEKDWRGGEKIPDPVWHYAFLTGTGGHSGPGQGDLVVRRWVAPRSMTVTVQGELDHPSEQGDGITGFLFSSKGGLLDRWEVHHRKQGTHRASLEVIAGEILDFAVDGRTNNSHDSFHWKLEIQEMGGTGERWHAAEDTMRDLARAHGPDGWVQMAQALLMCNELFFVD